ICLPCGLPTIVVSMLSSLFSSDGCPRLLHSFPTRRSSDLFEAAGGEVAHHCSGVSGVAICLCPHVPRQLQGARIAPGRQARIARSEEHTSELQSRENLVCRLLLEKKKNKPRLHVDGVGVLP